jgi:hypothetical protein
MIGYGVHAVQSLWGALLLLAPVLCAVAPPVALSVWLRRTAWRRQVRRDVRKNYRKMRREQ